MLRVCQGSVAAERSFWPELPKRGLPFVYQNFTGSGPIKCERQGFHPAFVVQNRVLARRKCYLLKRRRRPSTPIRPKPRRAIVRPPSGVVAVVEMKLKLNAAGALPVGLSIVNDHTPPVSV